MMQTLGELNGAEQTRSFARLSVGCAWLRFLFLCGIVGGFLSFPPARTSRRCPQQHLQPARGCPPPAAGNHFQ